MKKAIILFATILFCALSNNLNAQDLSKIGDLSFDISSSIKSDSKYGADKYSINATYLFNTSKLFKIGFGLGLAYNNVRLNEMHQLIEKDGVKEIKNETPYKDRANMLGMPIFLKMKLYLMDDYQFSPYLAAKVGSEVTSKKGISGNKINPLIFQAQPAIGCDYKIGTHRIGLEVGLDLNLGDIDNQYHILKRLTETSEQYSNFFYKNELKKKFTTGIYASVIFTL